MEQNEKRMAENYEITAAFRIGDKEVVFGEDMANENPYMTGLCTKEYVIIGTRERYEDCFVGDDYISLLEMFADRIKDQCQKARDEWAKVTVPRDPITSDMCYPNDYDKSIKGHVVAIKASRFRPEYQSADHQLVYVTGGNGAAANVHGNACFCINLYTGKESRWERYEVQGVVKPEHLPDWAKERAAVIQKEQAERQRREHAKEVR